MPSISMLICSRVTGMMSESPSTVATAFTAQAGVGTPSTRWPVASPMTSRMRRQLSRCGPPSERMRPRQSSRYNAATMIWATFSTWTGDNSMAPARNGSRPSKNQGAGIGRDTMSR